jgi:hypothetical protein
VAIRGLQADFLNGGTRVKWQVLVIQSNKNAQEFRGQLEVSFAGLTNGKPWSTSLVGGSQAIKIKQYGRLEGEIELPAQTVLKSVTAKVMDGVVTRATQTIKL